MAAQVRISAMRAASTPPAFVRISRVSVSNAVQGDVYVLQAGVWQPRRLKVRVGGVFV